MTGQDDLDAHLAGALDDRVEVVDFEPQQDSVSIGLGATRADRAVMMFGFKAV